MATVKVLRALVIGAIAGAATATLRCKNDGTEFQAKPLLISCKGSGANLSSNVAQVVVPPGQESIVGDLPRGLLNFKAFARTSGNVDLFLRDSRGARVDEALPGLQVLTRHTSGSPSSETLTTRGRMPKDVELVLRNNGINKALVDIGYYYDGWTEKINCPWKGVLGCKRYDQAKTRSQAHQFSQWIHTKWGSCPQAWQELGAPETEFGVHVQSPHWPSVFKKWHKAGSDDDVWEMYKFVTAGGFESGKSFVSRTQFEYVCEMQSYQRQFIGPCCDKLRTAFTDQFDAFQQLTTMAHNNARQHPVSILWHVCRSIPNVPDDFLIDRDGFVNYWHSGGPMAPDDLQICYPNGAVSVKPTQQPFVQMHARGNAQPAKRGADGKMPWERDGTEAGAGHPASVRVASASQATVAYVVQTTAKCATPLNDTECVAVAKLVNPQGGHPNPTTCTGISCAPMGCYQKGTDKTVYYNNIRTGNCTAARKCLCKAPPPSPPPPYQVKTSGKCATPLNETECRAIATSINAPGHNTNPTTCSGGISCAPTGCYQKSTDQKMYWNNIRTGNCTATRKCYCKAAAPLLHILTSGKCATMLTEAECKVYASNMNAPGNNTNPTTCQGLTCAPIGCYRKSTDQKMYWNNIRTGNCTATRKCICKGGSSATPAVTAAPITSAPTVQPVTTAPATAVPNASVPTAVPNASATTVPPVTTSTGTFAPGYGQVAAYPNIRDYPHHLHPNPPPSTTSYLYGTTMSPGAAFGNGHQHTTDEPGFNTGQSTSGVFYKGFAVGAGTGTAVAAAAGAGAAIITAVVNNGQSSTTTVPGYQAPFNMGGFFGAPQPTTAPRVLVGGQLKKFDDRKQQRRHHDAIAPDVAFLTIVAAICCCGCCFAVSGALFKLCRNNRRKDTDILHRPQQGLCNPSGGEDQEYLLSVNTHDSQAYNHSA